MTQVEKSVEVTAAVPSDAEIRDLIGMNLYKEGIQPVWLEVTNHSDNIMRAAIVSVDQNYFSPLEVAWTFRKTVASAYRDEVDRWFLENGLDRRIPPGETRSGFVFTHATEGTKAFNLDFFSGSDAVSFTFFVPVDGFEPDYARINFRNIYSDDEILRGDRNTLRETLPTRACCTTDQTGELPGDPLNVVIVGTPEAVRRSLFRSGWQETEIGSPVTALARQHRYRDRPPDATFHKTRPDGRERKELRLWLEPMLIEDLTVWLGHVSYDMSGALFTRDLTDYKVDPDVDAARMFLLQNFWYNQSLTAMSMVEGVPPATIEEPNTTFQGSEYFTDGMRIVLFVSEDPVGMDETEILAWARSFTMRLEDE